MKRFIFDMDKLPKTKSKEELVYLLKNKDVKENRDILIKHNLRLIVYVIKRKYNETLFDKQDLFCEGIVGLINAIDTFDFNRNIELSTYAYRCIDYEINKYIQKNKIRLHLISLDSELSKNFESNEKRIEDIVIDEELCEIVKDYISNLQYPDNEMIMLYFSDKKMYNQQYLAEKYNYSQAKISRKISSILKKIRKEIEEKGNVKILRK